MFEEDLTTYLKGNSDVSSAFTGAGASDVLVVPEVLAQGDSRPNISYELIAAPRTYYCNGQDEVVPATYRFRCQARTFKAALALQEGLRLALSGFRGTMGSTEVHGCFVENEGDEYYPDKAGREKGVYERFLDIDIHHEEEVPSFS